MELIFDAHLDLAMNALEWNRDLRLPIDKIRIREKGMSDLPDRGKGTLSCVATLIARYVKPKNPLPGWNSPEQAWAQTQGQLAWYEEMTLQDELIQIKSKRELKPHIKNWKSNQNKTPIGYILSLEGADSIISMEHLQKMYKKGLRFIGPAHYGPGTYANGTDSNGSIGRKGKSLLKKIQDLKLILDVTHLSDQSFWETIDAYQGPMWASHSNCRKLVPNKRQLEDEQIKVIIERKGVIGIAFDAWMLFPDWKRGITQPKSSGLLIDNIVDHIDHICQIAGNSDHVMIGSDLDGGFGTEQCPSDLDTISDLQKLDSILEKRGYSRRDIKNILSQNGINFLINNLPD